MKNSCNFAIVIIVLITFFSFEANAQKASGWIEFQPTFGFDEIGFVPTIAGQTSYQWTNGVGVWSAGQTDREIGQFYAGVFYGKTIKETNLYLEGGIAAGMESDPTAYRLAGYFFAEHDRFWLSLLNEYGGSGYWYANTLEVTVNRFFGIGVHAQTNGAHGPRVTVSAPKWLSVWIAGGFEPQAKEGVISAGVKLEL